MYPMLITLLITSLAQGVSPFHEVIASLLEVVAITILSVLSLTSPQFLLSSPLTFLLSSPSLPLFSILLLLSFLPTPSFLSYFHFLRLTPRLDFQVRVPPLTLISLLDSLFCTTFTARHRGLSNRNVYWYFHLPSGKRNSTSALSINASRTSSITEPRSHALCFCTSKR